MYKSTIIIRLIDIVLLLLFGFMVISEIDRKSPITLPHSNVPIETKIDKEELLIVGLLMDEDSSLVILIEGENRLVPDLLTLEEIVLSEKRRFKSLNKELRVRIRSSWNLPIKHTMRVANFCQHEQIPVGMDVQSMSSGNQ